MALIPRRQPHTVITKNLMHHKESKVVIIELLSKNKIGIISIIIIFNFSE